MENKYKGKLSHFIYAICLLPLLVFGIFVIILGTNSFSHAMYQEVELELQSVADTVVTLFDTAYPGDYHLVGDTAYQLYKGDTDLTTNYALVDQIKEKTGIDITLFYLDTRVLTTLTNQQGERIVGTGAPPAIIENVLTTGESHFYTKAIVNGSPYFSYYTPLFHSDGSVVGMLFVGKPCAEVNASVNHSIYPLIAIELIVMLLAVFCTFFYTKKLISSLEKIRVFLSDIAGGRLNAELDTSVRQRNDELGEIGHSALTMQRSLRTLVEQDMLTSLYNRRTGDQKLRQAAEVYRKKGTPFHVCIGDIDFFKKVNDTYGHECGDMVLRQTAELLKRCMNSNGFVARWGGEEFLLVYEGKTLKYAHAHLTAILNAIRALRVTYGDQTVQLTMTFGLTEGTSDDVTQLLLDADNKLYQGKSTGRDRIIL